MPSSGQTGSSSAYPSITAPWRYTFNKDLLDEYRVEYPDGTWDHDDYAEAMRRLTHDRDGDGKTDLWGSMFDISWDRIQVHVNGWGGHLVDPSNSKHCVMAAPEALGASNGCELVCGTIG